MNKKKYKQIESSFCGIETYRKIIGRTSWARFKDCFKVVYQYRIANIWQIMDSDLFNKHKGTTQFI